MSLNDKQKFVDLVVNLKDKKIVIELNNNYEGSYLRNVLYALNIINNLYIDCGDYYSEKIQGILINLNWYKNKPNFDKKEINYAYPKEGKESSDYLLKIININLDYYMDKCYTKFEGVDRLSKLLTIKNKQELKEFTEKEALLSDYYLKMDRLSQDEEYCKMVWNERIDEKLRNIDAYNGGKMTGINEGIEMGIQKNRKEVIINMYNDNLSIEKIAKYTNVSVDEINEIVHTEKKESN